MSNRTLFHSLQYRDVAAGTAFLAAVGFTEAVTYRDDAGTIVHAQYNWRDTGGVMLGAAERAGDSGGWSRSTGHAQCYCVVATPQEVDRIHAAALAAGGASVREPAEPDYGGWECAVADPEGNQWSFGTYPGA